MNRHARWGAAVLVLALLGAAIAGCARPLKDRVLGKWRHTPTGMTLSFLKDGSMTCVQGPVHVTGSYTTPDEEHLKIEVSGLLGAIIGSNVYEAAVKDDRLRLALGTQPLDLERVKE